METTVFSSQARRGKPNFNPFVNIFCLFIAHFFNKFLNVLLRHMNI